MAMHLVSQDLLPKRVREIVSYDAHHDCGYGDMPSADTGGAIQIDSENWLGAAIRYYDVRAEVVYPDWKDGQKIEDPPLIQPAAITHDDGAEDWHACDAVLLCHSGVWVPPWCDDQWLLFVDSWPQHLTRVLLEQQAYSLRMLPPTNLDTWEGAV